MIKKVEHIGIAVKDINSSITLFEKLLGVKSYKTEKVLSEGVNTAFFAISDQKIELLSSINQGSAIEKFLESKNETFDLVYIDPMFLGVQKSKAKKHMQALRDLSTSVIQKPLLKKSLDFANYRVIVKRHKNMEYLEGIVPNRSVKGKVVRYDIYYTN